MTTRLLFIGMDRVQDAIHTLKYDNFLLGIDSTKIYYGPRDLDFNLLDKLKTAGIDTRNFTVHQDVDLINTTAYHTEFYKFGGWIAQQFVKLLAINACKDQRILVQDCDTHLLQPYSFFNHTQIQPLVLRNETHSTEYYSYIEKILGIPRQTHHCFVTEFMPITNKSWIAMLDRIQKLHNLDWFSAIYEVFDQDYKGSQIWFSEYELLGNWQLYLNPDLTTYPQIRYESSTWTDTPDPDHFNSYCLKPWN